MQGDRYNEEDVKMGRRTNFKMPDSNALKHKIWRKVCKKGGIVENSHPLG